MANMINQLELKKIRERFKTETWYWKDKPATAHEVTRLINFFEDFLIHEVKQVMKGTNNA